MVTPLRVMVNGVIAGIPATAVVMMIFVAVGADEVAVMPDTDVAPTAIVGVAVAAKNPLG